MTSILSGHHIIERMRADDTWLVVDTETSGLVSPIFVVEIAAQRMRGWERDGEPFQVLLNHNVPIDPMAEAVHGYSREYLRKHGISPAKAHSRFHDYAGDAPIVAYNLSYDWDRALLPEYQRLGCPVTGRKGFCAMTLSRRTIGGVPNFRLETLKEQFGLNAARSHRGRNDVETLCALFERVIAGKLYHAGIIGFNLVGEFSRKTPVARCLEEVDGVGEPVWYYLDAENLSQGPYTAPVIRACLGESTCYVWREGMTEWIDSTLLPEFAPPTPKKARRKRVKKSAPTPKVAESSEDSGQITSRWLEDLAAICKDFMADGVVTEQEFDALRSWLVSCPCAHLYPLNMLAESVETIVSDGIVTSDELKVFRFVLESLLPETRREGTASPDPQVSLPTSTNYRRVPNLEQGTTEWMEWRHRGIGASDAPAIMGENPWKGVAQLLAEKKGRMRWSKPNAAMARGVALEPVARERFIQRLGVDVHSACLQGTQYDWLRASVDGISRDNTVLVEIKCGESVYRRTQEDQCVPDYYYGQLQHTLALTGLPSIYFFCYLPNRPEILLTVERNEDYIERLIVEERDFWQQVVT